MRKREVTVQRPTRMNILTMLRSESGCKQLQLEIKNYLNDNPWMPIKPMVDALEEDCILIPVFATIYTQKEGILSYSFRITKQTYSDILYNNWFRVPFDFGSHRQISGPNMRIFRNGLFTFAPDGFLERIRVQAQDAHPHHDRRYMGSFPRPMLDSQGIPIADRFLENRLTSLIKYQFEPILANDLQPVPPFVREVSDYLGKSTGNSLTLQVFV